MWSVDRVVFILNAVVMLYDAHTICVTLGVKDASLPTRWSQAGRGGEVEQHKFTFTSASVEISKVLLLLLIGLVAVWYDLLQTAIFQIPTCFLNYHRASACS